MASRWEKLAKNAAYKKWLSTYNVQNPDDPRHHYDYRAAFEAGVQPTDWADLPGQDKIEDILQGRPVKPGMFMWPDSFKKTGHPYKPKLKGEN